MKTVRFTQVVEKSGQPEVYLLFTKPEDDKDFQKALKADRIMTVRTGAGSKPDLGVVGYEGGAQAQVLIFPRSLKTFEDKNVVGIKYDLLHEERESPKPAGKKTAKKPEKKSAKAPAEKPKRTVQAKEPVEKGKVLHFPAVEKDDEESEEDSGIKAAVRRAMKALEDGKKVAAFNILKDILER
jgi:hypothetical protein